MRWKVSDNEYRVIYGDLHVEMHRYGSCLQDVFDGNRPVPRHISFDSDRPTNGRQPVGSCYTHNEI
jgi:hypothetical protein